MKQALLTSFLAFLLGNSFSQVITQKATIRGCVQDSTWGIPLQNVTLSISEANLSRPIASTLSETDGSFEFPVLKIGKYILTVTHIGYNSRVIDFAYISLAANENVIDLGEILLSKFIKDLQVVEITDLKPFIRRGVDGISYDVENDPDSKAFTILDMLRKVPYVSVDANDNIRLKGSSNFRVLLNGRPSAMLDRNPADFFKSMPADNVERIEVLATPPAKYEAEGLAGIVNIITKKKLNDGYSGSFTSSYNTVNGTSTNFNGNVKSGRFGVSGYFGGGMQAKQTTAMGYESSTPISSLFQQGSSIGKRKNLYGNAEISYEPDSLNLLTANLTYYTNRSDQHNNHLSMHFKDENSLYQQYRLISDIHFDNKEADLGINYQLGFKGESKRLLTSSYRYISSRNAQHTDAVYVEDLKYNDSDYIQFNQAGMNEHTFQVDYVHPVKVLLIEMGAKAILRNNFSNFKNESLNEITLKYMSDISQTNQFDYQQNVFSLYNSYQYTQENLIVKAGARLERTIAKAGFISANDNIDKDYINITPSVSLQRKFNESNSITLGYTERIERPGIWQLNPFVDKSNPKFISFGNPDLQPVLNHTLELNYSSFTKRSFTAGIIYMFSDNTIESVTGIDEENVSGTTFLNVGKTRGLGPVFNANFPLTKRLNTSVDGLLLHAWLKGVFNDQLFENKGFQGHIVSNSRYRLNKGYRLGVDMAYDSRYVQLQGKDNYFVYYSVNGAKDFLKAKATLSLSASNFLSKYKRMNFYKSASNFNQSNFNDILYRRVNVRFIYKFGKLKESIRKSERGIRNDDLSNEKPKKG